MDAVLDGRYRLGALIARGGMSSVYRGVDLRLDRPVAIKIMKAEFAEDESFLARFEREARAAAGLHHNGIVAMYDQGRDGDLVFLVMELVDGGTLRDLLKQQGALSVPVALSILEPVLSALGAAHDAGLVHRDVKPENVLISSRGEVKVADFGLVRAVSSTTMATGDVILGTVAYLSPEQVSTGYSDARSDVYSAGVLGFEMLTGAPPFSGDTAISVAYQHVHSDVPAPSTLAIGVPAPLDDIMVRATARNATDRPADAGAFLSELVRMRARLLIRRVPVPVPAATVRTPPTAPGPGGTQVIPAGVDPPPRTEPVEKPPPDLDLRRRKRRRRRIWIIAIIIALLAAAAGVTGWWYGSGRYTAVPTLIGVTRDSAVQSVESANLVPVVSTAHHNTMQTGRVASADPPAGQRELRGSEIKIVVSSGRPIVPAISPGTTPAEATKTLVAADLNGAVKQDVAVYDPTIAAGLVVRTDPVSGQALDIGTTVTLIVSKGKEPVTIPPVADKTVDDAANALKVAGLQLGPQVNQFDAARKSGIVIGTMPAVGTTLDSGATVQLVVSNSIEVPTLAGATQANADAALKALGLTLAVGKPAFDGGVDGGSVISSDPAAGALVDPANPTVTVVISNAITIPDMGGRNINDAANELTKAGLVVRTSTFFGFGSTVKQQNPDAGTRVAPGTQVDLSTY